MQIEANVIARTQRKDGTWSVVFRPAWDPAPPQFPIVKVEALSAEAAAPFEPGTTVIVSVDPAPTVATEASAGHGR